MQGLFSGVTADIDFVDLLLSLVLAALCAVILSITVRRFSRLLGDRSQFAMIFIILMPTMVLIISVVKSSLALSLGLVGALSIVRFRTPIKEPEELAYLFVAIGVGLGLGANQILPTLVAFGFIIIVIIMSGRLRQVARSQDVFLEFRGGLRNPGTDFASLSKSIAALNVPFDFRRCQLSDAGATATIQVSSEDVDQVQQVINVVKEQLTDAEITVIDRSRSLN